MSIQALTAAMKVDLPTTRKFVLLALANYVDQDWRCWPSQRTLAKDTGLGERSVREHLRVLEADGYITRDHRQRETGFRNSDLITIVAAKLKKNEDQPESPAARKIQPATDDIQPADDYQSNRQEIPPNLSVEPLEEPSKGLLVNLHSPPPDLGEQFCSLWDRYRTETQRAGALGSKADAETAFRRQIKAGATAEQFGEALTAYVSALDREGNVGTEFVMRGERWFRKGWRDEITDDRQEFDDWLAAQ